MTLSAEAVAARSLSRNGRRILRPDAGRVALRAGSGLGDSLYLQSVARHLIEKGERIEICSDWPDVFRPLIPNVKVSSFRRDRINRVAHYTGRKHAAGTDQFQDMCLAAGITEPVDLRLDWVLLQNKFTGQLRQAGKPVILVQLPRNPMGRTDGFGAELLPDCSVIQKAIEVLRPRAFIVQVGAGAPLYRFSGIDLDLACKTSVVDLIDVASVAHGFLGYCSFIIPLAESLSKPALLVWSRRGLNSQANRGEFIRAITPQKVLHRRTSHAIVDDCSHDEIEKAAHALLDEARGPRAV